MSKVINANIEVHSRMAATYDTAEPHFRPENQAKVRQLLTKLRAQVPGGKLLDLGCGTGFILNLAEGIFEEISGVDVTQAMLDRVDTKGGKIKLHNARAERTPFPDASFDLVTAYSFIHHTEDYFAVLREAARVLKPGGICYVDLEPNKAFWEAMTKLPPGDVPGFSAMLKKARDSVTETDAKVEKEYGIPKETFALAEFSKSILGGIDAEELRKRAPELGFKTCEIRGVWFLGQAEVMHGKSFELADQIDAWLREIAPVSDSLFKYLQAFLYK